MPCEPAEPRGLPSVPVTDGTASGAVSTTNACRMCMPLGACLAFAGIEGCVPFLHGSQGCATYIRRYLISHFNEPLDVASSSFGEASTVFGGEPNLREGLANVTRGYTPAAIGVATTCLTETIGEDVPSMLRRYELSTRDEKTAGGQDVSGRPALIHAATPSYAGTHADGYQAAVAATVATLAEGGPRTRTTVLLPGMVSTADLRHLAELATSYGVNHTLLPDFSERLDAPAAARYERLPAGGTPLSAIVAAGRAKAAVRLGGLTSPGTADAGSVLASRFGVPLHTLALPIGIRLTDAFTDVLAELGRVAMPAAIESERGRLIDAYVDGHKYVAGKRAVVYGDEDLVVGLTAFLTEIGIKPVLVATGGRSTRLRAALAEHCENLPDGLTVLEDADFATIGASLADPLADAGVDLFVGHSKGYHLARHLGVPLVRVGLPVHDRIGGQRLLHLGYRGAQQLFDRIVNELIAHTQDASPVGYSYM